MTKKTSVGSMGPMGPVFGLGVAFQAIVAAVHFASNTEAATHDLQRFCAICWCKGKN